MIVGDSIEEVLTTIAHPQTCIKSAATTLLAGILSHCSAIKDQHWPPTVEIVTAEHRSPPDTVKIFLNTLLLLLLLLLLLSLLLLLLLLMIYFNFGL